jgi:hypothetical protein
MIERKCLRCDTILTGNQRKFCCKRCKMAYYSKINYALIKELKGKLKNE